MDIFGVPSVMNGSQPIALYAYAEIAVSTAGESFPIMLQPGINVQGKAVDADAKAIPGWIGSFDLMEFGGRTILAQADFSTSANENGEFTLRGVPPVAKLRHQATGKTYWASSNKLLQITEQN